MMGEKMKAETLQDTKQREIRAMTEHLQKQALMLNAVMQAMIREPNYDMTDIYLRYIASFEQAIAWLREATLRTHVSPMFRP